MKVPGFITTLHKIISLFFMEYIWEALRLDNIYEILAVFKNLSNTRCCLFVLMLSYSLTEKCMKVYHSVGLHTFMHALYLLMLYFMIRKTLRSFPHLSHTLMQFPLEEHRALVQAFTAEAFRHCLFHVRREQCLIPYLHLLSLLVYPTNFFERNFCLK